MTLIILILILVLILLYAVSQVIPIGGIIVFAVIVGLSITPGVYLRRKRQKSARIQIKEKL